MLAAARWSKGFTLVEVLVGAALGLVLLAAIIVVFVGSRAAYSSTSSLSHAQESARVASQLVSRELRLAGYVAQRASGLVDDERQLPAGGEFATGTFVHGRERSQHQARVRPDSDQLELRYQGDPAAPLRNCVGAVVPAGQLSTTRIYVSVAQALMCESGGAPPVVLVDGIADLQLGYGVDGDGDRQVDRYVDADAVGDWSSVLSVRVALTVARGDSSSERSLVTVVALRNALH